MSGLIQHPELFDLLDSGLNFIPDPDPGRNDGKENFSTFYVTINIDCLIKRKMLKVKKA